jgi:hypothetical protein
MNNPHFNDEYDHTNDDGYLEELLDSEHIPQEWLDEEDEYWAGRELDSADPDEYDSVEGSENDEPADSLDRYDEDWDWDGNDTPIGLEYDGYNDPEDY